MYEGGTPMKTKLIAAFLCATLATSSVVATETTKKPAYQLMEVLKVELIMQQSVMQMLAVQLHYNPFLAQHQETLYEYLYSKMGYTHLKDDLATMYSEMFTEAEINEMIKFYQSDTGQKSLMHIQRLVDKVTEIGAIRVQNSMPELLKMLDEDKKEQEMLAKSI